MVEGGVLALAGSHEHGHWPDPALCLAVVAFACWITHALVHLVAARGAGVFDGSAAAGGAEHGSPMNSHHDRQGAPTIAYFFIKVNDFLANLSAIGYYLFINL